ncbi:glycosyl transferase [Rahnella victoriana]|uniref:polyprenol monophosphomannose synthase n=1 Tax=Rahnella victoriana TaxID=1510570 RepID=UPI000BB1977C|nr:polyprenol monophosphomannose synthase [Rahnella victoriana]PBI80016.1 glycosyl transferase [Rahnella victoriana]
MKKLIFFATYNEAGNVTSMIERISIAAPDADILIVDDNSKDGTLDILKTLTRTNLKVIVRPDKLGLGTAHLLAFKYAIFHSYDILVTMDGDHSHDPADIPKLINALDETTDLVIGSRYASGGKCDYTGYRLRVSQAANKAAKLLLGIKLSEFTTSFRAFRVSRLNAIDFDTLVVGGYSFFLTVIVQAYRYNLKLSERPIHFHERNAGVSKIPPLEIFRGMANLLRLTMIRHFGKISHPINNVMLVCNNCSCEFSLIKVDSPATQDDKNKLCLSCGNQNNGAVSR